MIRHRSRHLRATLTNKVITDLTALGWMPHPLPDGTTSAVNFGTNPITVIDYQPDERGETVTTNTVAVSIGDVTNDEDEELGASAGGLRSAWYPVFIDVYMADQALTDAVCDDIREIFDMREFPLVDQIARAPSQELIDIEEVIGPDRPGGGGGSMDQFKKYWRIMRLGVRLYYQSN